MKNTEKKPYKKNNLSAKIIAGVLAGLMFASVVFTLIMYL